MKNINKKIKAIFAITNVSILFAAFIHIVATYVTIANDLSTSFPPSIAFYLIIPYATVSIFCDCAMLVILKIIKNIANRQNPC